MTYLNAKKYISLSPTSQPGQKINVLTLLERLGNPQRRIKYVRLAGSNGKTVCAEMLRSITKCAGFTVGCLRMPVRQEPRENVCIGESTLSMDEFAAYTESIKRIAPSLDFVPTKAEILLCIALCAFRDAGCEFCLIESDHFGDDPSIALPPPFAAVICGTIPNADRTAISRIRSYICRGIQEIVSAPQDSDAYRIISDTCYSINCRLSLPSRNQISIDRLTLRSTQFSYKGVPYTLNLCGKFQVSNAVLVLEVVEMLSRRGYAIPDECVARGLSCFKLPAKFEVISLSPLMIIDSTHTPVAISTVCDSLADFKGQTGSAVRLCLPRGGIISNYINVLEGLGYTVESVFTDGQTSIDKDIPLHSFATPKALARAVLDGLDKNTVLMVSGDYPFVNPVRYEILNILGF